MLRLEANVNATREARRVDVALHNGIDRAGIDRHDKKENQTLHCENGYPHQQKEDIVHEERREQEDGHGEDKCAQKQLVGVCLERVHAVAQHIFLLPPKELPHRCQKASLTNGKEVKQASRGSACAYGVWRGESQDITASRERM